MEITPENLELGERCKNDFSEFIKYIFPLSFRNYIKTPHLYEWADRFQNNKKTATLSARGHLKSTMVYALIMWKIYRMKESEDWLYMSYTEPMSQYHTKKIKRLIQMNPVFEGIKDLTFAESILKYTWDGKNIFTIMPASIMRFNRGWHGIGVICDDILADPTSQLNLTVIKTISLMFFEDVMQLPNPEGELHLVGTPAHQEDIFFEILNRNILARKEGKSDLFDWNSYPAIVNEKTKEVLWKEMWSYERLMKKQEEIGYKAFQKEYMCSPVWSEDAYFKRDDIIKLVDPGLKNRESWENLDYDIIAGFDIGKMRHPSHFTVFLHANGLIIQIYQLFMDNWDYTKQVEFINTKIKDLNIKRIYYDDTRSELESFAEQGIIRRGLWSPVKFSISEKYKMAANFSKSVSSSVLRLQDNPRMIRSILSVNNKLEAIETNEGHGDAFWSIALALSYKKLGPPIIEGYGRKY